MDKNFDYNSSYPPFSPYYSNFDSPDNQGNYDMFSPMMQYEQGYMYYRYLTQQLEYKIKCKEYEKFSNRQENRVDRRVD